MGRINKTVNKSFILRNKLPRKVKKSIVFIDKIPEDIAFEIAGNVYLYFLFRLIEKYAL